MITKVLTPGRVITHFSQTECNLWSHDQNKQHGELPSPSCRVADHLCSTYHNFSEKIISRLKNYSVVDIYYVCKDMIKARPTSRELNSCRDQHSCRADPRADLRSLHSGQPDTRVDTRPRSSLSVGLVYVSHNGYIKQ